MSQAPAARSDPPNQRSTGSGAPRPVPVEFRPGAELAAYLAAIVESSDDAIIGQSLDGTVFSWNGGAQQLYGYGREEMLGRSIERIVPPERREEFERLMGALRAGERIKHIETEHVRRDGRRVIVSLTVSPLKDLGGRVIGASAIARDITDRKQSQAAEQEALARLRAVIEAAVDGIITIDERGTIESVNPAALRIFGYAEAELVGENVRILMPEPYRSQSDTFLRNHLETGRRKMIGIGREVQGRRKDGSVFPMELAVSETRLRQRRIFTGMVRDISRRREAELALQAKEAELELVAKTTPVKLTRCSRDLRYRFVNRAAAALFDLTPEQMIGRPIVEIMGQRAFDLIAPHVERVLCGEPVEYEAELPLPTLGPRWLRVHYVPDRDESGQVAGWIASIFDITEGKRAEEALRRSEERYRAIVEGQVEMVCRFRPDGTILFVNGAYARARGSTPEALLGVNFWDFIEESDRPAVRACLERLSPENPVVRIENRFETRDGVRWTLWMNRALAFDAQGRATEVQSSGIDITHRKRAEEALRESEERFAAFMRHLPGAAWMKDLHGRYVYANPEAARIFGKPLETLLGRTDEEIFPPETARQFRENDLRALQSDAGVQCIETLRQADGVVHRSIVSKFIVPGADRRPGCVGGAAFDVTDWIAAEDALRQSEERYRQLIQNLPSAVYACDADGRLTLYNDAAVELWGRVPALGQDRWCGSYRIYDLDGNPVPLEQCPMAIAVREKRPIRRVELVIERPDGTRRSILANPVPTLDADGSALGAVNMLIDLTEFKQVESALRDSERRFRLMADSAPNMIWMSDVDKRCTWFNRRWLEFTGRPLEQELGDGWTEGVHPDDLERCLQIYHQAFDERRTFEMEYRLRRHDGEYRWLCDAGVPIQMADGRFGGYIGSCIDITDRKVGEEVLRERVAERTHELRAANEQLHHQIAERTRIESLLATENRILELIAAGADLHEMLEALCSAIESLIPHSRCVIRLAPVGWNLDDEAPAASVPPATAGVNVFGALAESGICPELCRERTVLLRDEPGFDESLRPLRVRSYWFEPIIGPGGALLGTVGVYCASAVRPDEDALSAGSLATRLAAIVIERARAEERAREQLAQLAHVARLATMGEMASGLAHELNQPLCAIVNFTEACVELLQRNPGERDPLPHALGEVARQAERAGEVIRRLRDFVKRREPQRIAMDVNGVIREVVAFTSVELRHCEIRVRVKLAKRLPKVLADPIQIQQVLVNLVRNACEAMRENNGRPKVLTVETARVRGAVEVRVTDQGPGIPEEIKQRLFEPFFTTKRDGMGMGLSISRSILEVHEGRMWVTSNHKGGSTFHFSIPTAWRARRGRRYSLHSG